MARMGELNKPIPALLSDVARSMHDSHSPSDARSRRPTYLSAVKKYFENQGVDTTFFKHSQYIRNTKQGLTLAYCVQTNRPSLDAMRLPITADMILLVYHRVTANDTPTPQQRALFVAQLTGFTMVARVSEYLFTSKSEHWLKTERVQFELPDGTLVPAQRTRAHTPYSRSHPHQNTKERPKRTRAHAPLSPRTPHRQILLRVRNVGTCEMWAHPKPNCPFFAIPSEDWVLKIPQMSLQL